MTPQTGNLWALNGQLFELLEMREEALATLETAKAWRQMNAPDADDPTVAAEAELKALESAIGDFVATKVTEVTEIRAQYMALIDGAAVAKAEAARATNRAMILQSRADRVKELVKGCMETLGAKRFESAMGYFLLRGNGGAQPVTITDESLVPDELCQVRVTMSWAQWMDSGIAAFEGTDVEVGPREPRKGLIGKLLASGQPVAGARLEERGTSLQIK